MTPKSSKMFQNPAGPYAVRTSNFVHVSSLQLTKAHLMKSQFALDRVSSDRLQTALADIVDNGTKLYVRQSR